MAQQEVLSFEQSNIPFPDMAMVPNEILVKIFSSGTRAWQEEYPDQLPFPLLVCGVCRHWRILAQSTPQLWSFIIPPLHLFGKDEDGKSWTSEWLSRSGTLPLSAVIDDRLRGGYLTKNSQSVILGVLRAFHSVAHRLRRLDIWSHHIFPNDLHALFQNVKEPIQLRQLSICSARITQTQILPHTSPQSSLMFSWFAQLPRMHKLRLAGAIFPLVSTLTTLCVHGLCARYSEIQTIFSTCPNIRTLVLPQLLPIAFADTSVTPRVLATALKSLAVSFKRTPHLNGTSPYLVSVLLMPDLEYLEIHGDIEISWAFDASLSSGKVQTLRLSKRPKGLNKADQLFLRSLQNLHHLELVDASVDGLLVDGSGVSVGRKRSTSSLFSFTSASSSLAISTNSASWSGLTNITLNTLSAEDVMHLCRFVNLHRGIRAVWLSKDAKRHLTRSLVRNGDIVYMKDSRRRLKSTSETETSDVEDWLCKQVDVKIFKSCFGLLDREGFPLQELH